VSLRSQRRLLSFALFASLFAMPARLPAQAAPGPTELARKVKTRVQPAYPDIARRMNITGTVKIAVVVSPDGAVKSTKVVGGHPLLVNAAVDALKKWKFEPASQQDTGVVEFKFEPEN
jgi:TonB family protein